MIVSLFYVDIASVFTWYFLFDFLSWVFLWTYSTQGAHVMHSAVGRSYCSLLTHYTCSASEVIVASFTFMCVSWRGVSCERAVFEIRMRPCSYIITSLTIHCTSSSPCNWKNFDIRIISKKNIDLLSLWIYAHFWDTSFDLPPPPRFSVSSNLSSGPGTERQKVSCLRIGRR